VTHDRYLIDALGTQIWEIDPDETKLSVFRGTYSERKQEYERLAALRAAQEQPVAGKTAKAAPRRTSDPAVKEQRRKLARLQELENKIASLETQLAEIGFKLENPPADTVLVRKLGNQYAALQKEMDAHLAEWESLQV